LWSEYLDFSDGVDLKSREEPQIEIRKLIRRRINQQQQQEFMKFFRDCQNRKLIVLAQKVSVS
jgi:hypothetical protein